MAEPWMGVLAVAGVAIAIGAIFRTGGWLRRRRGAARVPAADRIREARHLRVRVEVDASSVFPGMSAKRRNITIGDLALSPTRCVLATERGVLLDLSADRGRPLRDVRCTGPGRLVIEGDAPRMDGAPGSFRIELALDDAAGWAAALQRYVRHADAVEPGWKPRPAG